MNSDALATLAVVALLVVSGIGGFAGVGSAASPATTQSSDSYVVEQGELCQPIEPLSTNRTVDSFYDYRNHETNPDSDPEDRQYSSYGTAHLQEDDTSLLMLHEGTDGMSLVVVHDRVHGDSDGGVATFDIVGLPGESEWVVQDDLYEGESNMAEWDDGDGWASASWIWADGRTDGGAINGGLNDEFAVTIHPAFNENSPFYDDDDLYDPEFHEGGEITDWQILSGDSDDPDRTPLPSLEEPVTIRTGTCDDPSITYDRSDDDVTATITDASPEDEFSLEITGESDGVVQFERLELTDLDGDQSFAFEHAAPDGLPASPDDADSLGGLTVTGESTDQPGAVTFSVDAELFDEDDLEPEAIALYEVNGSSWNESETTIHDESGETYQFSASVSSLDGFVVAQQDVEPAEDSQTYPMPGFGAGAAIGVVATLSLLWAVRYRE
ncbi:hypothetical protein EA462_07465 [Natrarchaeobius halalkaliphilus]|uniref:PGF-pre-PGF domain-containing protein n=1 Tax=Natrarchaeobius halalkaliphilus TaxID=1679091 RepID=A0A3N6M8Q1_9EURY|nr:hypothetical protein [Natrarchaeobius halalkaliphilus]RQG89846.1 hypothetical protein EA462_07465 [Natrarchaeobius halalkaliphilus]